MRSAPQWSWTYQNVLLFAFTHTNHSALLYWGGGRDLRNKCLKNLDKIPKSQTVYMDRHHRVKSENTVCFLVFWANQCFKLPLGICFWISQWLRIQKIKHIALYRTFETWTTYFEQINTIIFALMWQFGKCWAWMNKCILLQEWF